MRAIRISDNHRWLITWIILTIFAALASFIGGLGYFYVLALFLPLIQTFSLTNIPEAKAPWLWMLHFPYWLLLLQFGTSFEMRIIGLFCSSILGQLIIYIMFRTFGKFSWLLFNTLGLGAILLGIYFLIEVHVLNDFLQVLLIVAFSVIYGYLSGIGIMKSKP